MTPGVSDSRPPGRLVDVSGHRLHLVCHGDGSPAVIFDAALGASSLSWGLVQPEVARITQTCAYDRAGFGWSEAGPLPRTAGTIARELHTLLTHAGIPPPYVLVGHSFGGLVMRLVAAHHRDEVAGLVLVDPAHPEEWLEPDAHQRAQVDRGVRLCRHGATAARLGIARLIGALVALGALAPARALVGLVSRGGLQRTDEQILAPIWKLSPEARRSMRRSWVTPKFFEALGSQIGSITTSAADVRDVGVAALADLPLVVLSAATSSPRRLELNEALARCSSRGQHRLVDQSGHWIPLDAPSAVVQAVAEVIRGTRRDDT